MFRSVYDVENIFINSCTDILKDSFQKIEDGKLHIHVQDTVKLEDAPAAMKCLKQKCGKVVLVH